MTFNKQQQNQSGKRQQGFVLILALVMLTVLTLIGVSSMKSASIELKATANAQQNIVAFIGTQSALEFVMSRPAENDINWTTTNVNLVQQPPIPPVQNTNNLATGIAYIGCSKGIGSSLQAGKGLSYSFFTVAGNGSNLMQTSTSLQTMGVRYPAASC